MEKTTVNNGKGTCWTGSWFELIWGGSKYRFSLQIGPNRDAAVLIGRQR